MTNEGGKTCPVCTEEMDSTDLQLKPCKCGYQVCVWCWHHIMDMAEKDGIEGRCPACRTPYDKEKIVSMAASIEISAERKPKSQKVKSRAFDGRKHLSNVRVVQRHLVYTMGIPANLADEDVLQRREYFGQYGKVLKASLTRTSGGAIQFSTNNTCSVYITYSKEDEAVRCIQSVHGYTLQGQPLRACFGTTKYCHAWLRNMPCSNPDCVYLHDVGNQEDSFTKDEIVSAYTRVQQITGATNNSERQLTGNILPPPIDDPCLSASASSKPISRSPSDNPPSQLKSSPPNSSSGRSISLPAAASWGLRVSNGHTPTATTASLNGPSKQKHEDSNGSVGFPSLVASTTSTSTTQADVGKKSWVIKEGRAVPSSREVGSSEFSKTYAAVDHQKTTPGNVEDVAQEAAPTAVTSYLGTSRDDNGIPKSINHAVPVEIGRQLSGAYSDRDDNVVVDGKIQTASPELPSVGNDGYVSNDGLHQSYPEHARGHSTSLPPRNAVTSDSVFVPRESSDWGSEAQTQVLQDTRGTMEDDILAFGEQNSNFSEVCHPLHLQRTSSPINISSSSNGHSWSYEHASGTSNPRDHRSVHTKSDEVVFPYASNDSVLSNGYIESNVSASTGLEKIFEQSNMFSSAEKGKYSGRENNNPVDYQRNTSVDMGESNIISNILSMDFDSLDQSLASPQDFAKLLSETDQQLGGLKIRSSRKEQKSNQSRFSFARQVDSADQGIGSDLFPSIGNPMNTHSASQLYQENQDIYSNELQNALSSKFLEESDAYYTGIPNMSSNRFSGSRAPVAAPPGFSTPSKIPPPGFATQERMDTGNHYLGGSSMLRSQYQLQPTNEMPSIGDVELIDPAILAVGTGRPANGINDYLDLRSPNSSLQQLNASENDPRFQLLRQQYLPSQQTLRYSDHLTDRYSPLTDAYNTPSRYLDQSQYAQQLASLQQPRTESLSSHGWNSWNDQQTGNSNFGMAELLKSERYGYNQYYPEYDNRNSRLPKQNDIYNKAYGM
ncbi:RING-type E3 ubiquitin transferase [Ranunculus cassubicifolius]